MANIEVAGSRLGTPLQDLLGCDAIEPGAEPSYQMCKTIYLYHPLGGKMAESPINMAQSQDREITIPGSPEDDVREAFLREWEAVGADTLIHNTASTARVYGIASLGCGDVGKPTDSTIDLASLAKGNVFFNVFDPLNTAGSLVLNQDPNSPDFQKHTSIAVAGQPWHRSRTCTILNEQPIYISYTSSGFGFVGRSVYQRALFPLKTFIQSMKTDDMVTRKAGVLVAKIKQPGSIVDGFMAKAMAFKRNVVKEAQTDNVINISAENNEEISSLHMQGLDGPAAFARTNVLKNIATAADMPAQLIENETMVAGFGEGTEDAKNIARYIERVRKWMKPLYVFMDRIVMYRAWNPEFYATIQAKYPEVWGDVPYNKAFFDWCNAFKANGRLLLIEPESERIKVEEIKLKAITAMLEVLLSQLDPENRAELIQWACDNINEEHMLFSNPLALDMKAFLEWTPSEPPSEQDDQQAEPSAPKPWSSAA